MRILVTEDEVPAQTVLRRMIEESEKEVECDIVRTGQEALSMLDKNNYDLMLLDIVLPDLTGLEVLKRAGTHPPAVLMSAHDDFAVPAFEHGVVDYLMKPFSQERLSQALQRSRSRMERKEKTETAGLAVKQDENYFLVRFDRIVYLSSSGKRTVIHTIKGDYVTGKLLGDIEQKLPQKTFLRVHKSYVINLRRLSHIQHMARGDYIAYMDDGEDSQVPVSRNHAAQLKRLIGLD